MKFHRFLVAALLCVVALDDAGAWRSGYFPTFTAPGVPGRDYAIGRTSTNPLRKAVISTATPLAGFSASSVTIGTGSKVFTIDTALTAIDATNNLRICSGANVANYMQGTVTSLVTTTLTVNVTSVGGAGTFSDWVLCMHLPANASDDVAGKAIRIGSSTSDFTFTDWDFRGLIAVHYIQLARRVTYSQSLLDMCALTVSNITSQPFLGVRSAFGGQPSISLDHVTINGCESDAPLSTFGSGFVSVTYCDISTPTDWWNGAPSPSLGPIATEIAYSRIVVQATTNASTGLHADGIQFTSYPAQISLSLHHLIISLPNKTPVGGVGVTGAINWNTAAGSWDTPTTVNNVIMTGGAYTIYLGQGVNPTTQPITFGENVYVGLGAFGPTYPVGIPPTGTTIAGLKNVQTGAPVTFTINGFNYTSYP